MTVQKVQIDRFGGPEVMVLTPSETPVMAAGEVLVEVEAIGVNFADTMVRRGEYRRDQALPHVPGMEAAGTVIDSTVASHPIGARVALFLEHGGGYSQVVAVDSSSAFVIHGDHAATTVAGTFLQGVTAWYAVHRYGRVTSGDVVLVTGAAGGVGGLSVQLAREAGAMVIGTASSESKRAYLTALGCHVVLDPGAPDLSSQLAQAAPGGADVVLDGVGGDLFMTVLRSLARNGRFVVVGSATQSPAMLDVRHLLPRGQSISGFVVRNVMDADPREPSTALHEVLRRVTSGALSAPIEVLGLTEVADAHRRLEARQVIGKLVLDPRR